MFIYLNWSGRRHRASNHINSFILFKNSGGNSVIIILVKGLILVIG